MTEHRNNSSNSLDIYTILSDRQFINFVGMIKGAVYLGFSLFLLLNTFAFIFELISGSSFWQLIGYGGNIEISPQICHLVDFDIDSCRFTGGFSSPNHLAGYLLLILPLFLLDSFVFLKRDISCNLDKSIKK
jgi:hypothetical protein